VACTDHEIVIRHYYAPAGVKRITYSAIERPARSRRGLLGTVRIHGSGNLRHWFNYGPGRPRKSTALVLVVGARIRPVITPDDPGRVAEELAAHGVRVTSGRERGLG
jgi:hypothetical protein